MKFILIGAGQRGMIYAKYAHEKGLEIVAVAEPNLDKREHARELFGISDERCYQDAMELLNQPKMADAAILATMDRDHYHQAIKALEQGYHLLLEKPISPVPQECAQIAALAKKMDRHVVVCHVLRYAPFFREIKKILDENRLGRVVSIQHNENIGNFHMAHSFVRGNWCNSDLSSPIIMQKSCHDMDLLVWLVNSTCKRISSFGSLEYFNAEHAPEGAALRCVDCPRKNFCRYSAYACYMPVRGSWPTTVLTEDQSEEGLMNAIAEGPYGRCVYHCDNNVCDHQVTIMEFANGVTATFNLSAFTNRMARTMKIMCEDGEIRATEYENRIEVTRFVSTGGGRAQTEVIVPGVLETGHGGGDSGIMEDFIALVEGRMTNAASDISCSVESHYMACAAEQSRVTGMTIDMKDYRDVL